MVERDVRSPFPLFDPSMVIVSGACCWTTPYCVSVQHHSPVKIANRRLVEYRFVISRMLILSNDRQSDLQHCSECLQKWCHVEWIMKKTVPSKSVDNFSRCIPVGADGWNCQCPPGFTGATCETASVGKTNGPLLPPVRYVAFSEQLFEQWYPML